MSSQHVRAIQIG